MLKALSQKLSKYQSRCCGFVRFSA